MKAEGYIGLDVGGTGAKAGVFDREGKMLGFGRKAYTPAISTEGHAELPIQEIYEAARVAANLAVRQAQARILSLAISSQGQTFVSLDTEDKPLHPAILWYDSRARDQADRLLETLRSNAAAAPLPVINAIATAPKIMWLRERYPTEMSRARRFFLLPDYLTYRLTGQPATDPIIASTTGLYAHPGLRYHSAALDAACVLEDQLARVQPSGTPIGNILPSAAEEWSLSSETLVTVGTNDQYAGALGAGNYRPGIVSETSGTCLAFVTLCEKIPDVLPESLFAGCFPIPIYQSVLGFSKTAGVVLDWFSRELEGGTALQELDRRASLIPIGSDGITVIPHFDGMISPVSNPNVRGAFINLSLQHSRAAMYRAILESLAFSLRENLELLTGIGFHLHTIRSIGGGAVSDFWMQMKADVTGAPIEKPAITEAAMLGAAMLAAVGYGQFSTVGEASHAFFALEKVFTPCAGAHIKYETPYRRYLDIYRKIYFPRRKHSD
jgi:xylulokinase